MKKIILNLLLVFMCATYASAQELAVNTTRFVGGDASCGYSIGNYSIATKDGGILFVGETVCYSGGGDIPPNFPDASGSSGGNVLIGKLDSNMSVSWVKVYGGTQSDYAVSAVQTADGGYAVLAYTESNDSDVSGGHGTGDIWLLRLDSSGNLLWQKCYGSAYDEQPGAIAVTPDNGFIFYGISNGAGDDVPTHYSGSEFDYDWVVIKTDSTGTLQWSKSIGGQGDEESAGSIIVANNAYYLVSSSNSTDYDCTDTAWCAGNGHATAYNYYIFKLDTAAGNIIWDSSYGGSGGDIVYDAIWDSRDSSIVMNGYTGSADYMITGYNGGGDMWVVKVDRNGVLKWEKCLGGPNIESGSGITLSDVGYVAYGNTYGGGIGYTDNWLSALDDTGRIISNKVFGGAGYEDPYSITPFKNGCIAMGTTGSESFTDGNNIGHLPGPIGEAFFSYISYWPLGVSNVNLISQQMAVYPNPSAETINITTPDEDGHICIANSIGEIIVGINKEQTKDEVILNVAGWANGLYIIKWQGADGTVLVNKFIKN